MAGVSRVISSLWSVDDSATAELMTRFYREMLVGQKRLQPPCAPRSFPCEKKQSGRSRIIGLGSFYKASQIKVGRDADALNVTCLLQEDR